MNYESKYNELVEAARAVVEGNPGLCDMNKRLGRVRDLLPEKESEDERIRKEILEYFNQFKDEGLRGANITPWISYLEKRKEQKPAECIEDSVKFKEGFKAGRESGLCDGQKYVLDNLDSYGLCRSEEWSEEDDRIRKSIIKDIEFDRNYAYTTTGKVFEQYNEQINWLKFLPERFNLQPKQEWSEEDTEMYINVASSLRGYACGLENEEHKRHIQKGLDWLENRFKSLRPQPHWKPSEKQIDALNSIILTGSFTYVGQGQDLISLKDELKKL